MATLEHRLKDAEKGLERAKDKARSAFKYNSEQIEMLLGRADRLVQSDSLSKVHGYGSEIKDHAEKIDSLFEDMADLLKEWKTVQEYRDDEEEDLLEDELTVYERSLKDFLAEQKSAEDSMNRTVVKMAMKRLKSTEV